MLNLSTSHAYEISTLESQILYFKKESNTCSANSMHLLADLMYSYFLKTQEELKNLLARISKEVEAEQEEAEGTIKQPLQYNDLSTNKTISVLPLMNRKQYDESCHFHTSIFSQTEESIKHYS